MLSDKRDNNNKKAKKYLRYKMTTYYEQSYYEPAISHHQAGSQTWFEAVNSEFLYEQQQINNLNFFNSNDNNNNNQMLQTSDYRNISNDREMYFEPTIQIVPEPIDFISLNTNCEPNYDDFSNANANALVSPPPSQYLPNVEQPYHPLAGVAPCQGPRPWNFAQCYGFYDEPACPLLNMIDMEDFM